MREVSSSRVVDFVVAPNVWRGGRVRFTGCWVVRRKSVVWAVERDCKVRSLA